MVQSLSMLMPASWLRMKDILMILHTFWKRSYNKSMLRYPRTRVVGYNIRPRKPFAHGGPRPRLQDQKNALLYYAGLLNEFDQGDKVIVDCGEDDQDSDEYITGIIVGVIA